MWKKAIIVLGLFAFMIAVTVPADNADARPRSFSSGKSTFKKDPSHSKDQVNKSSTTDKSSSSKGTSTNRGGFFSGGSFMKGMMIGGLAGLLFGGFFGTGFLANMMGLIVNVLALFVLFMIFRGIFDAIKRRRQTQNPNQRRW
ncbi:hypothetical protein [Cohnella terricola]|uniref:hypothetical protein n=1 Tax=Cohnella terricola TaxID=1289167 RepID=UPI001645B723|nr:hypothetical protein [Cohnella terricola]